MLPAPQLVLAITLSVLLAVGNVLLFARLLDPSEFSRTPFLKFSAFVGLSLVQAAVFLLCVDVGVGGRGRPFHSPPRNSSYPPDPPHLPQPL